MNCKIVVERRNGTRTRCCAHPCKGEQVCLRHKLLLVELGPAPLMQDQAMSSVH